MGNFIYFATSVFAGLFANFITIYLQRTSSGISVNWVWIAYLLVMIFVGVFAFKHFKKSTINDAIQSKLSSFQSIKILHEILYNYASHPEILNIIDRNGKEYYGGHAGNLYWKEFAANIIKEMNLTHLHYSTLGTEYHLEDIKNGKKYNIPIDNKLEEKVEKDGLKNGQIFLIKEGT
ncbi:MAG: hypothetical protein KAR45_21610 [Desulfobacteraceae bacterium]|nr:hypothetical protein [Desulfobacteraceae bacterium]